MEMKSNPVFVAISDIHFSLINLNSSSYALTAALNKAEELKIPLIIAGDLNDTKAIIRAEVANTLIRILQNSTTKIFILIGNHDLVNEKGQEHCLNFLRPYATIIDYHTRIGFGLKGHTIVGLMPYQSDLEKIPKIIESFDAPDIIVCHQGIQGAAMGDYIIDKSATTSDLFKCPTISGHYHRHQTIGNVTYIGSPFTMSFGEANDGLKGFLVVNDDGTYTKEILNLRKHLILGTYTGKDKIACLRRLSSLQNYSGDIIWIKLFGPQNELDWISRKDIVDCIGMNDFKLDKIPDDKKTIEVEPNKVLTGEEILDKLIDENAESKQAAKVLKKLWRESTI